MPGFWGPPPSPPQSGQLGSTFSNPCQSISYFLKIRLNLGMPGFWDPHPLPRVYYLAQAPPLITHLGVYDNPLIMQRGDLINHDLSINFLKTRTKVSPSQSVIAQLVQRSLDKPRVAGSSPRGHKKLKKLFFDNIKFFKISKAILRYLEMKSKFLSFLIVF